MRVKIAKCFAAVALAASICLAPFSQAAYAYIQLAIPAGYALATVCAVLGLSVPLLTDDDASSFWGDFELFTGDLDAIAAGVSSLQDTAIATGNLINATKSDVSQQEIDAIKDMFEMAGQAGSIALDKFSTMASDGALGLIPFLLSLFIADQTTIMPDKSFVIGDVVFTMTDQMPVTAYPDYKPLVFFTYGGYQYALATGSTGSFVDRWNFVIQDGGFGLAVGYLSNQIVYITDGQQWNLITGMSGYKSDLGGLRTYLGMSNSDQYFPAVLPLELISGLIFYSGYTITINNRMTGESAVYNPSSGIWSDSVTDNPDVNLGHDYWDDAKENKDILNPAAGASIIGADAVIDGDYIANRGSLGVITDWADINSWADALARAHAGVAEGALDGTISGTATGTAVNVGTGELVTDAVGDLVKPNAGTSLSPSKDFDWGKFLDPSLYLVFPFCLPWDLVELVKTLIADPQAPVIDWPMPTLTGQQNLHVDLSPWSPVAAVLRAGELVVAAVGLIWITKTMIRN